jgi:hypothetical protein
MKQLIITLFSFFTFTFSSVWSQCNVVADFTYSIGANGLVTFYNNSTDSCFFYSPDYLRVGPNDIFQIQFMANATHNILMIAGTDDGLCYDSLEVDIEITNITCLAFADLIILQQSNACNFTNNSNLDGMLDPGDGTPPFFLGVNETYLHGYILDGTYDITLIISDSLNPGCTDTAFTSISFSGLPGINCNAYFEYTQSYDSIAGIYSNDIVIIDYSYGVGTVNYQWLFWGELDTVSIELPTPTHTFTTPGIKEVAVLLNDSENCGSSFSDTLFISAKSSGYTVTVIHYNDLVANIDNIEQTISSKVFPNPVNENYFLEVNTKHSGDFVISVTDVSGKIIDQTKHYFASGNNRIYLSSQTLESGIYFLSIQDTESTTFLTHKIIKE